MLQVHIVRNARRLAFVPGDFQASARRFDPASLPADGELVGAKPCPMTKSRARRAPRRGARSCRPNRRLFISASALERCRRCAPPGPGRPSAATAVTSATISTTSIPGRDKRARSVAEWRAPALAGAGACVALAATILWPPSPLLLWNASASSPVGLYAVGDPAHVRAGDFAVAWPPPDAARLASRRHYLPAGVPLVKRVAATSGAAVCAFGPTLFVDGERAASRRSRDRTGRRLPSWSGCVRLRPGETFLLSPGSPDSFDGRYFGLTRQSELVGSARLLWSR